MQISAKGKPLKIPVKLCKQACEYYLKSLVSKRTYDKLKIKLVFDDSDMESYVHAYCHWNNNHMRSKDFTVIVNPNLGKRTILLALAHEMVHVKQYSTGELMDYMNGPPDRCKWQGKIISTNKIDYWETPWEIEAHGREKGLYFKFADLLYREEQAKKKKAKKKQK